MEAFLLIVPPGYTKLLDAQRIIEAYSVDGFRDLCVRGSWGEIDGVVEAEGQLPAGMTLTEAVFVDVPNNDVEPYQVWMKFGPLT